MKSWFLLPVTAAFAAGALLAACQPKPLPAAQPLVITTETVCSLDGMLLADYPGPKAQIHYDSGATDFFCDTVEALSMYLQPEQQRRVRSVFVQDMGRADWERPEGHWIDARQAYYVQGSRRRGSMGPTLASFAQEAPARDFAGAHGGEVLRFEQITVAMVALDGGALHDRNM